MLSVAHAYFRSENEMKDRGRGRQKERKSLNSKVLFHKDCSSVCQSVTEREREREREREIG